MSPDNSPLWPATVAAAILRRGASVHALSLAMTVIGCIAAVTLTAAAAWLPVCLAVVAIGVAELWLAARVAIDAELFTAIAADGRLDRFDCAMLELGLMPENKVGRSLASRIRAALRLLKMQASMVLLQIGALLGGAVYAA